MRQGMMAVLLVWAILGLCVPGISNDYFVYEKWGGTWHDINKTWVNDKNLCWAASAANIIDWTGWETDNFNNDSAINNN